MNKIKEWIGKLRAFFDEVIVELKKCAWPTGQELMESTAVVIVSVLLLAAFVATSDGVMMAILQVLVRH